MAIEKLNEEWANKGEPGWETKSVINKGRMKKIADKIDEIITSINIPTIWNSSFDSIKGTKIFIMQKPTNGPVSSTTGTHGYACLQIEQDSANCTQIAIHTWYDDSRIYVRRKVNNTWKPWYTNNS